MSCNNMKFFFLKNKKEDGFTLVETLVAISIFTISVLAVMINLGQGISDTGYAKKKIIAASLAQEGVEYIRNIRDTYVLFSGGSAGWILFKNQLRNPPAQCDQAYGCYFDDQNLDYGDPSQPITKIIIIACDGSCPELMYDEATGKYTYDILGTESGFIRKIKVDQIRVDEIKVSSTVFWAQGSGLYNKTFSENLFNRVE